MLFDRFLCQTNVCHCHTGHRSISRQLLACLESVPQANGNMRVVIVGHSLGGALAVLNTMVLANSRLASHIFTYTDACPPVLHRNSTHHFDAGMGSGTVVTSLHVCHSTDLVPLFDPQGILGPHTKPVLIGPVNHPVLREQVKLGANRNTLWSRSQLSSGTVSYSHSVTVYDAASMSTMDQQAMITALKDRFTAAKGEADTALAQRNKRDLQQCKRRWAGMCQRFGEDQVRLALSSVKSQLYRPQKGELFELQRASKFSTVLENAQLQTWMKQKEITCTENPMLHLALAEEWLNR